MYSQVLTIDTVEEANWITFSEGNHKTPEKFPEFVGPIDLLEVYASENSRLTEQINSMGGKAMRFTKEHGDLGTPAGQRALLEVIDRTQPRHIWVAPECGPWCAWSRFNMGRSLNSHQEISLKRIESLKHLRLCTAILKIQILKGRHFHMENPEGSEVWGLKEVQDIVKHTIPVRFDQCQYGLRHPNNSTYLKKGTRIQTTSEEVQAHLNGRFCQGQHPHSQIAGSCVYQGKTIRVSRFSAFYPVVLAKTLSKSLLSEQGPPSLQTMCVQEEAFPADIEPNTEPGEHPEAPKPKRLRVEGKDRKVDRPSESHHGAEKGPLYDISNRAWETVFSRLQTVLPKSGTRTWSNDQDRLIRDCQALCPDIEIKHLKAGKGLDKYLTGPKDSPFRQTIVQSRFDRSKVYDLGTEDWLELSQNQQKRKALPSHIMIGLFGHNPEARLPEDLNDDRSPRDRVPDDVPMEEDNGAMLPKEGVELPRENSDREKRSEMVMPVPGWSPAPVINSGPKYLELSSENQNAIKKMHHNLGHPTADRLSKHLSSIGMSPEIVAGARDYQCGACAERKPPAKTTPGRPPTDFNDIVSIDVIEWKGKEGVTYRVLHALDEATHFHQARRCPRDAKSQEKTFKDMWIAWAGSPKTLCFDAAGEYMSQNWKDFLQSESIVPEVSAAPWQRGRIERHGGTLKEMISRMDHQNPIKDSDEFDSVLQSCCKAKNTLINHQGYSPEQAVLGKSSRIPGSILSDEQRMAHDFVMHDTPQSEKFRQGLERRLAARQAFLESDNHQAARRALLRQSRGLVQDWQNGQLCMYWDKRKAPNMLEQGRWCGPAQVVMHESRAIVWVTHMNRLLRCARENLRPISLSEMEQHRTTFAQRADPEQVRKMAEQLTANLREKSGLFQYSDLSQLNPEDQEPTPTEGEEETVIPEQPEEEPKRRVSTQGISGIDEKLLEQAINTPVPKSPSTGLPMSNETPAAEHERSNADAGESASRIEGEVTVEDSVSKSSGDGVADALCVEIIEATEGETCFVGDSEAWWPQKDSEPETMCTFEFSIPKQQLQKYIQEGPIHECLLVSAAKKSKSEVTYSRLNEEEKTRFQKAKDKEIGCWLDTQTVKRLLRNRIHPSRIMSSRWILTWKEDPTSIDGKKAKARLVVRGYEDPELDSVNTDSPTLSRDARMLLMQTVSSHKWQIQSFDITTAFLRGRSDGRQLAMEPVEELRQALRMGRDEVCLLEGNAYGRVDAPLLFYKEFRQQLETLGFEAHPLDNCLFLLRNSSCPEKLDGILGTHVDDGIGGGNNRFEEALRKLQNKLPFGSREHQKFKFTGLDIEQLPDFSIKVSQKNYVMKINPIDIPKTRRQEKDSPVTSQELQELRGLCGSLQYAAVHSRPDIATKVAHLQKSIPNARVEHLLIGNKVLIEAKEHSEVSMIVRPLPLEEVTFASFGDASFASQQQLRAQQGLFIMACTDALAKNETSDFSPIVWNTKQIGRVVRSTLSAEAYAMSSSLDKLNWIRVMWGYIRSPKFMWQKPERSLPTMNKGLLITDCKSLYDLMTKSAVPNTSEWRTTIEVMLIREQSKENAQCRWISTAIMLADPLTKPMDSTFLRTTLGLGRFRIYDENKTLQENANRKYGNTWVQGLGEKFINKENITDVNSS